MTSPSPEGAVPGSEDEAGNGIDQTARGVGDANVDHAVPLDDSRLRALGLTGDQSERRPDPQDPMAATDEGVWSDPLLVADTPMWLSHHPPLYYDRCARVAGLHVCRRCLVLYPLALVAGVVVTVGNWWNSSWDPWVLWLFPLPGVVEFVLDNLGVVEYRPRRQLALSALGAVAAGVGYTRYLRDFTDPLVWSVVAVYTAACLSAAVVGGVRRQRSYLESVTDRSSTIGGDR